MLVTSIFSFSHNVFYNSKKLKFFSQIYIVFGPVKNLIVWLRVNSQGNNSIKDYKIQSICIGHIKCDSKSKIQFMFLSGWKILCESIHFWQLAISPFTTMSSKPFFFLKGSSKLTTVRLNKSNYEIAIFVAFVKDNANMSSIPYFENHVRYFVQN